MINRASVEQVIEATCPRQTDIRTETNIVFECVQLNGTRTLHAQRSIVKLL